MLENCIKTLLRTWHFAVWIGIVLLWGPLSHRESQEKSLAYLIKLVCSGLMQFLQLCWPAVGLIFGFSQPPTSPLGAPPWWTQVALYSCVLLGLLLTSFWGSTHLATSLEVRLSSQGSWLECLRPAGWVWAQAEVTSCQHLPLCLSLWESLCGLASSPSRGAVMLYDRSLLTPIHRTVREHLDVLTPGVTHEEIGDG